MTVEGMAYHVLNRRVMRMPLFQQPGDYEAFQRIMAQGLRRPDAPLLLGWCLMPNHWHRGGMWSALKIKDSGCRSGVDRGAWDHGQTVAD
jgi:hypothetical protein